MKKWDVIIIGSGMSGLTCGCLLSKQGKSVCVLESHKDPGGWLRGFTRFGLHFDTGAHYIGAMGEGQPFQTLLKYMNAYDENLFAPLYKDGFDILHFPNSNVSFRQGYEETIEEFSRKFPNERLAIRRYFDIIQSASKRFPTYYYTTDYNMMDVTEVLETPLSTIVDAITSNPTLKYAFYSYASLHGVSPRDIGFGFHAIITDSLLRGPYGFRFGGEGLAKKMVSVIQNNGGTVLTNTPVEKLNVKDRNVVEIITATGESMTSDWVISSIHPRATCRMLDQDTLSPAFKKRISDMRDTTGIFCIYAKRKEA